MQDLNQNSILVSIRLSKPGNRRKVPSGLVEIDADKDAISVSKELLESKEFNEIGALDGTIRRYIYARSLPSGILREGVYRLPLTLVDEVDSKLSDYKAQRHQLAEAFLATYPAKSEEARTRLRSLYDPRDYPIPEALRQSFDMQWRYITVDVPESLSASLIQREREKARQNLTAEMDEIRLALRTSFAELVQHAADRLSPDKSGKPRIFRDSLVKNMEDFLNYFAQRNLTADDELDGLVEKARAAMQGVNPQDLRDHDGLRKSVQETMSQIKNTMDAGLMLKPSRKFTLEPVG